MKKIILGSLFLTLSMTSACGHKKFVKYKSDELTASNEKHNGGLNIQVISVKSKGKSLEITFSLSNKYNHTVQFETGSPQLTFNDQAGMIANGDTLMPLPAGMSRKERIRFDFYPPVQKTGTGVFSIDPILTKSKSGKNSKVPALTIQIPVY